MMASQDLESSILLVPEKGRQSKGPYLMKAWLERMWSWVKAGLSTTDEWEEKEEQEYPEQEEPTPLQMKRQNRPGETDGFRVVGR